jgi:N-acyl-D-amino-acid deacylase
LPRIPEKAIDEIIYRDSLSLLRLEMKKELQDFALDLILTGGQIIDGSGGPPFVGDLGIRDGKIAAVGSLANRSATKRIDVAGRTVVPGFIDIHTHSDISLLQNPLDEPRLSQGVTTVVFSNCGIGFAPATDESLGILKVRRS